MKVIDSAESTADAAALLIHGQHAAAAVPEGLAADPNRPQPIPQIRCFATDSVEKFERLGSRFLGRPVGQVELVDLGG